MAPSATDEYSGSQCGVTILNVSIPEEKLLQVVFGDGTYTFHAQWLHDCRDDRNPSRSAEDAFSVHAADARILSASHKGKGANAIVTVDWADGHTTDFPGAWLRVFAPMVAQLGPGAKGLPVDKGWMMDTIEIVEVDYAEIFPQEEPTVEQREAISIKITDLILHEGRSGIIKVVNMPPPDVLSERNKKNTLVTKVLKQVFGSVFVHPRRGVDQSFNVSDNYGADKKRGEMLHNYRTDVVLLPHCDHAHYDYPAQIQGLYCLEGDSHNTFVSSVAVLETMRQEAPELYPYMLKSPMVVGRMAHYYDPPMFQATVEPAVTMAAGFPDSVRRIRWHPHLAGGLVAPFEDFARAREAYQKFQEIMRRPSHQLTVLFRPGDLYIWNNFRTLHGRESVLSSPRTSVGQTVPEQVVSERYRSLQVKRLKELVGENWLVHVPMPQLFDMARYLGVEEA